MTIGFVLDDTLDSTDGVQQYVLTMGSWLSRQGHEVHYLVGYTTRRDIKNVHSLSRNISVRFNKNRMSTPLPASKRRIRQLLDRHAFDVLHVQMPFSPFLAGKVLSIARQRSIPAVATFHILPAGRLELVASRVLARLQARTIKRLNQVMSVSRPAKEFVDELCAVDSTLVPNPVHVRAFAPTKSRAQSDSELHIVFLGRLVSRKGCYELLKALRHLKTADHLQNVRVTVCGDGPERQKLESYVAQHGLQAHVTFAGKVSQHDKIRHLRTATLAVFPSMWGESFGIVLLEAMAAGAETVLAGDNPGYRWVLDGREPQLVDPRDTSMFAAQLQHFLSDKSARKATKSWQQQRVQQFDVSVVGAQLESAYKAAIAKSTKAQDNTK